MIAGNQIHGKGTGRQVDGCGWVCHTPVTVLGERQESEEAPKQQMTLFNLQAINSFTCFKLKRSAFPSHSSTTVNIRVSSAFRRQ